MYAEVNQLFGDIVKVTPTLEGRRRHGAVHGRQQPDARTTCWTPSASWRSPSRWSSSSRASSASRRAASRRRCRRAILRGRKPLTDRPGATPAAGRLRRRPGRSSRRSSAARRPTSDVLSLPALPAGLRRLRRRTRRSTPTLSVLPTPVFFYGMQTGRGGERRDRAGQDADRQVPDRRRAARRTARGRVFFELNGQPREVRGAGPLARRGARARHGRRPSRATRSTSPRRCRALVVRVAVAVGRRGRRRAEAAHARSDEDGDDALRRPGGQGGGGAGPPWSQVEAAIW